MSSNYVETIKTLARKMSSATQDPMEMIAGGLTNQPSTDASSINSCDIEKKVVEKKEAEDKKSQPQHPTADSKEHNSHKPLHSSPLVPSRKDVNADAHQSADSSHTTGPQSPSSLLHPYSLLQSSTALLSPSSSSSLIFERNVQESPAGTALLSSEEFPGAAAGIPAHILQQTDDQIPAVLEASSIALTDGKLAPEDVEIVVNSAHVPAAVTAGSSASLPFRPLTPTSHSHQPQSDRIEETRSTSPAHPSPSAAMASYSSAHKTTDPRRLSFISFADVVHSEQVEAELEAQHQQQRSAANSPRPGSSTALGFGMQQSPPLRALSPAFAEPAALTSAPGSPGSPSLASNARRRISGSRGRTGFHRQGPRSPPTSIPTSPSPAGLAGPEVSDADVASAGLGVSSVEFVTERMSDAIEAVENA